MHKLIIIDDELFILEQLKNLKIWDQLNFEVVAVFNNSCEAIEFIDSNQVDAVLTDIKMPYMDGLEIAKICNEKYPYIKVAIISAYREFEYAVTAIKYNVTEYITKPIDFDNFSQAFKNIAEQLSQEKMMYFMGDHRYSKTQQFFTNILYHNVEPPENIQLSGLETLSYKSRCALINLNVNDLEIYLQKKWNHSLEGFYNAISQIIEFEEENSFCILLRCLDNNLDFLIISKNSGDFDKIVSERIMQISKQLNEFLPLKTELNFSEIYNSVSDLINCIQAQNSAQSNSLNSENDIVKSTLEKVFYFINTHLSENITSEHVAEYISFNSVYFRAYFKHHTGETFITYLTRIRMEKACELLLNTNLKISAICDSIGYINNTHFYKVFKQHYGITPTEYRKNQVKE